MRILFDLWPVQAGGEPAARACAALFAGLRQCSPTWEIRGVVHADHAVPTSLTHLPTYPFRPLFADRPEHRCANALHFADWLASLNPDWVLHPGLLECDGLAPRYGSPHPRVGVTLHDPAAILAKLSPSLGSALRTVANADTVFLASPDDEPAARRLLGSDVRFAFTSDALTVARALEAPTRSIPAKKPRLAWVSPPPPAETGVADYALEVAIALADRFDLEWVIDPRGATPQSAITKRFVVVPANEFEARQIAKPYDLPVYHLGNNAFHLYQLPLMRRHPGLIVAHDTHTGGLFRVASDAGVWPSNVRTELEHNGEWLLSEWVERGLIHAHTTPTFGGFSRRIFADAVGVLVHSTFGWQQVRKLTDAPACVVPMMVDTPPLASRLAERRRLHLSEVRFLVVSLGLVTTPKRPSVIVRAVAALPEALRSRTQIVLVGPCLPKMRAELETLADELGVRKHLEFRGKVPLADFPAYARAADACVQLRYPTNGETSAGLARALAAGAACIVSDTGSMTEFPNTVALKVRSPALDVEDLTAALTRLADEPGLRDQLGEAARRYTAEMCGRDSVTARYAAAIADAILRRDQHDGRWRAAVATALADLPGEPSAERIAEWAELRAGIHNARSSVHWPSLSEPIPLPAAG